jgi:hypothetical protein
MLIFDIYLKQSGFTTTVQKLKQFPLPKNVKESFQLRLISIRNMVATDVALQNNTEVDFNKL